MSERRLLRLDFGRSDLVPVRSRLAETAIRAGLSGIGGGAFIQAALELASNAVLHGGGTGTLEVHCADDELRCTVTDHGPGLPSAASGPACHGLRLAEALSGRLELCSAPSGRGTTATVAVRLLRDPRAPLAAHPAPS